MAECTQLTVHTVIDNKVIYIPYIPTTTAEDVCIVLCKQLGIGPVARHLFSLRLAGKQLFLMPAATFADKIVAYDLRIRYKVANVKRLKRIDIKAYDYYFHQARNDVLENKIPNLYEKYKRELVGLGVTDMYRVMLEKDIPKETVVSDYKKYIPKEVIKRHSIFIKKPILDTLGKIKKAGHDTWYVKAEYLSQLEMMAPEYLTEEYKAVTDQNGSVSNIYLKISPQHSAEPSIKISYESKKEDWQEVCGVQDLCFVSIRKDGTVEISRKNGIPYYLKFHSVPAMLSFVSLLDGYYRLSCKWTFNLCKDVLTPSLQRLQTMKCHGPVGGEFSYAKLEEKRLNHPGCFILRECESKYNIYYLDVCMRDGLKPKTFKMERLSGNEFVFNGDVTLYKNIQQLIAAYNNSDGTIYLQECLPPSEYDKSPLLLCQNDDIGSDSLTDSSTALGMLPTMSLCINSKDIQVYKGQRRESSEGTTVVYRSMWRITKGKKMEVAMKVLKRESCDKYLKDFLELTGKWCFLQSNAIVRLFGVTLISPVSMVLEYMRLGRLDEYLRINKGELKPEDLIEAASNVAAALWHLEENGIVHGNIRCKKLMVSNHAEHSFTVKLCDPGIHQSYASKEVHWIPIECYTNLEFAKRSTAADVWAFSTTLWEIFMFGEEIKTTDHVDAMRFYKSGKRLPQPPNCPSDIYQLMRECWDPDPHRRKQPQAVMRDINQILYQVYNSRRVHSYAKIFTKGGLGRSQALGTATSTQSLLSNATDSTCLTHPDELISISAAGISEGDLTTMTGLNISLGSDWNAQDPGNYEDDHSCDFSNLLSSFNFSVATSVTSLDSINSMQSIFELDADCNVILQGRIGQGFYGEVYKGTMEYVGDKDMEPRQVAVKKLKTTALSTCLQDFEREISIMKTLKHPNIVEILGVLEEPEVSLVMEYVQHGSLQSYLKIYREALGTKQLLKYALDIAKGMHYLGTKHIVHRDLAARNILVVDENHVKISDFGLAQVMGSNEYYILKTNRELPIKWYAPETLRFGKFSPRSDVWSYGVTMCEMFAHGEEPKLPATDDKKLEGQEQQLLLDAIEAGLRYPCPLTCPQAVYVRIIYPCWQTNPHERPSFSDLHKEIEDLFAHY